MKRNPKRIPLGGGDGPRFNVFLPDGCLYRSDDGTSESEFPRQQADQIAVQINGTVKPASDAAETMQATLDQHPGLSPVCTCSDRQSGRQP